MDSSQGREVTSAKLPVGRLDCTYLGMQGNPCSLDPAGNRARPELELAVGPLGSMECFAGGVQADGRAALSATR